MPPKYHPDQIFYLLYTRVHPNQDYLEQRKNLDSLENINRELNQS